MAYAILRFEKRKGGTSSALEQHHERKKESYYSNSDIDIEKSKLNYHIVTPQNTYNREIEGRIQKAGCRVRRDSVKFIDTLITASPEFFNDADKTKLYFQSAVTFMKEKIGEENIFSAVVHLDEKTPHMHLCFTPITKDKRLSAKEILGNRTKLSQWQDEFYAHMQQQFNSFERGKKAIETKREHIPIHMFKQATLLSEQLQKIQKTMSDINMLNASKKRDMALKMLNAWYPQASSFISQMKKVEKDMIAITTQNKKLNTEIQNINHVALEEAKKQFKPIEEELKWQYQIKQNEYEQLINEYNLLYDTYHEYKEFIDTIPPEVMNYIKENYSQKQDWGMKM